jgi:LPXTG-motif cell wall-anchored protein
MNTKQRFKLGAGAGLVTMLLGALMVLAPGAGAEHLGTEFPAGTFELEGGGQVPICHATSSHAKPYILNTPSFSATGGPWANHDSHGGPVYDPSFKDAKPKVVWGDIIPPVAVDDHLMYAGSDNWDQGGSQMYSDCIGSQQTDPVVIVQKDVPGDAVDPTLFAFSLTGNPTPAGPTSIADGGSFETTVVAGSVSITETEAAGYSLTGAACTRDYVANGEVVEDEVVTVSRTDTTATLTAVAGDIITCTFTNTPDTYGVSVVKKNDANGDTVFNISETAPSAGSPVKFQVDVTNTGNQDLTIARLTDTWSGLSEPMDLLAAPDLLCKRGDTTVPATLLPAATTTSCTFTVASYSPAAGASRENTVSVTTTDQRTASGKSTVATPTPTPMPATLQVNKVVDAPSENDIPDGWTVEFEVIGDDYQATRSVSAGLVSQALTNLDADGYVISERVAPTDTSALTAVDCVEADGREVVVDEDLENRAVLVVLEEGDDVECTFTNTYPAVLPAVEEPVEEPKPAVVQESVVQPATEVKGVQTVRTLPRTGDETRGLAGVGAFMLALGAAMVIGSRRQLARR